MQGIAIKFKKNIAQATIDKTAEVLNQIRDFSTEINQRTLELERGYDVLRLKAEVGAREMRRILKAAFPLSFKDIMNQLAVAELHNRLPQFHDKIINLGISACNELLKASNTLAARLLEETIITVTEIKKIVSREKKGFAIAPTDSHRSTLTPGTIVEIVKKGKTYGWLAEVIKSADAFGRLTVRLLKTCKSNQVFVDEVQLYKGDKGVDGEGVVNWSDWESLRKQYDLSDNNLESIRETAYRDAQQHASEEDVTIQIKWKHVQNALDKYGLQQKFSPIATNDSVTPLSDSGETEISRETEALESALREMEELRTELAVFQARNDELETKNKQLLQSQNPELKAVDDSKEVALPPAIQLYLVMAAASQYPVLVTPSSPKAQENSAFKLELNPPLRAIDTQPQQLVSTALTPKSIPPTYTDSAVATATLTEMSSGEREPSTSVSEEVCAPVTKTEIARISDGETISREEEEQKGEQERKNSQDLIPVRSEKRDIECDPSLSQDILTRETSTYQKSSGSPQSQLNYSVA